MSEGRCDACLTVPKDNVDGELTHVDCGASESAHHILLAKEWGRAEAAELRAAQAEQWLQVLEEQDFDVGPSTHRGVREFLASLAPKKEAKP